MIIFYYVIQLYQSQALSFGCYSKLAEGNASVIRWDTALCENIESVLLKKVLGCTEDITVLECST